MDEEVRERDALIARNQEEDRVVAEAAFEEAIEEGVDPREAAFRAEQAVRENKVGRRLESLEEAVGDGKTLEQALGDELDRSGGSIDELFIIEEGAFRSLDAAFRDPNSGGFSRIVDETFNEEREGRELFEMLFWRAETLMMHLMLPSSPVLPRVQISLRRIYLVRVLTGACCTIPNN